MKRINRNSSLIFSIVSIIIVSLLVFSFGCSKKEEKEIVIGHIAPLTGDAAMWGRWEVEGINLAVEEINAKGGIGGRKIKIIHEDDKADPKTAVSALQKLIAIDKVKVVIGATLSSPTLACAPVAEKNKVVLLSPSAQSPKLSEAGSYIFKLFASNSVEGKYLAKLADQFHIRKAALLYLNNDYGLGLRNVINQLLSKNKISILAEERYDADAKDFRTQIEKIKSVKPEAIFILGYPTDMGSVLLQIKELGLKTKLFAPDAFEAEEITKIAKDSAEGVIYVYPIIPDIKANRSIKQKFYDKNKTEMNIYNAVGYDAVKILAFSIENVLSKRKVD